MANGLLISQIGYDLHDTMRALYRADNKAHFSGNAFFTITEIARGECVKKETAQYWGEKWNAHWWVMDFSGLLSGVYIITLHDRGNVLASESFEIGSDLLWRKTAEAVGINQFEERAKRARNQIGWKDCGAVLRESVSHAIALIGLTEFLAKGFEWFDADGQRRLRRQLVQGADYLAILAELANQTGYPKGAMFHEIPQHMLVLPRGIAQSVIAWGRVSRLLADTQADKSLLYLSLAEDGFQYFLHGMQPHDAMGFSAMNHGVPDGYQKPDEWETRDLLLWLWGGLELVRCGKNEYLHEVVRLAEQVIQRQVAKSEAEDGLYGHFFAFSDRAYTQKANTHHHIGHDTGGVFPFYIAPFIDLLSVAPQHPDAPKWRQAITDFAYGFFLPACRANPFYIVPEGIYQNEGLLNFCGPWHGMNVTICFGALLAVKLEEFFEDTQFRDIAVGSLQWIAGLNAGVTRESFASTWKFKMEIGENQVVSISQIHGIGKRFAGCWSNIRGTVMNGFSANPQFQLSVKPTLTNDTPANFTDEDWIPHGAAYVGALAALRLRRFLSCAEQAFD